MLVNLSRVRKVSAPISIGGHNRANRYCANKESDFMHEVSVQLIPQDREFHETEEAFTEEPSIQRVAIEYLNYLDDGTGVLLYRLRGNEERISELLENTDEVISFQALSDGGEYRVHIHFDVYGFSEQLIRLINQHNVSIDFPIECNQRGLRITAIGEQDDIADAVERLPDGILVEIISLTPIENGSSRRPLLSDRQREVLRIAIEEGYYEHPRKISRDGLAEFLGLTGSTVSEHLRKAESKILTDFIR